MTDVARLVVKLDAQIGEFSAQISKATGQIQKFGSDVESAISGIAKNLLALYVVKEAIDFTVAVEKSIAALDRLSQQVGIAVESLSELKYAAKLQGVDDLAQPLNALAKSAGLAAEGNEKAIETFNALGVSATDAKGKLKPTEQLLLEIADSFSKHADGIGKSRLAQEAFNRSGPEFIAFLNQGAAGIKAAKNEAIDLGLNVSEATAKAADEFDKNMTKIEEAGKGVFTRGLALVTPELNKLTEQIVAFAKNKDQIEQTDEIVATGFRLIATTAILAAEAFLIVGKALAGIVAINEGVYKSTIAVAEAFVDPKKAWQDFKDGLTDVKVAAQEAFADMKSNGDRGADEIALIWGRAAKSVTDAQAEIDKASKAAADKAAADKAKLPPFALTNVQDIKGIDAAIEKLGKLDSTLQQQAATYGLSKGAALAYDLTLGQLAGSVQKLNNLSEGRAEKELKKLHDLNQITDDQFRSWTAAVRAGEQLGDVIGKHDLELIYKIQRLTDVDAFSKLDQQLLVLTGHFEEAAQAATDLAQRSLKIDQQEAIDRADKALTSQKAIVDQLNASRSESVEIQDRLAIATQELAAAEAAAGRRTLAMAGEESAVRNRAKAEIEALYIQVQALAQATKDPQLVAEAQRLQEILAKLGIGPHTISDLQAAATAMATLKVVTDAEKRTNDELAESFAKLNAERNMGQISDLGLMHQQDVATAKALADLKVRQAQLQKLNADFEGANEQVADALARVNTEVVALEGQIGQLARTIREDFENAATDAFTAFATGAESASEAVHQFLSDIERQLIQLGAKSLFQDIFGDLMGPDSAIGQFLSGVGGGGQGAALGTAVATGGATAATEMEAAIVGGGSIAAGMMASAIAAAGAAGSLGIDSLVAAAGGSDAFGAQLWSLAGITGLAGGGDFEAGTPYIVGENGPELMIPATDGRIVPSGAWGKGVQVVNHFHIEAPKGTVSRATQGQIAAMVAASTYAASARNN